MVTRGNLLSTFRYKLANTSSWSEIFLILSTFEFENNRVCRKVEYHTPSDTASYSALLKVRRRGFYCVRTKTVRCRTSLCFVITAVQLLQIRSVYIPVSTDRIWRWIVCLYFVTVKGVGVGHFPDDSSEMCSAQRQDTSQTVHQKCVLCTETGHFTDGTLEMCTVHRERTLYRRYIRNVYCA